ncbi:outer membrane lipid asymmetry maintenance protein MlaD [Oecophyllibacter saccharovorans]
MTGGNGVAERMVADSPFQARQLLQTRVELGVGLVVTLVLVILMGLALAGHQQKGGAGYVLHATFSHIDGLDVGSEVQLAGVPVGHVLTTSIDPHNYQAEVAFTVAPDVQLPVDSGAIITSASLLGGKYIALSPGGDTVMLKPGGVISETQGSISLEQLLSKFIFSVTDSLQQKTSSSHASPAASASLDSGSGR